MMNIEDKYFAVKCDSVVASGLRFIKLIAHQNPVQNPVKILRKEKIQHFI